MWEHLESLFHFRALFHIFVGPTRSLLTVFIVPSPSPRAYRQKYCRLIRSILFVHFRHHKLCFEVIHLGTSVKGSIRPRGGVPSAMSSLGRNTVLRFYLLRLE